MVTMVKSLLGSIAILAAMSPLGDGMEFFEGGWDEAVKAAERNGQLVFVDVYTEWCGPCKLMDANVYPKDAVGDYFNPRFVNIKLDAEDEEVDGPEIAERYDIGGYPTLLFLNPDGSEIGRGVAGLDVGGLIRLARELTEGEASEFADMQARHDAGERERGFVQAYLKAGQIHGARIFDDFEARSAHRQRMAPVFDEYFASTAREALINSTDFGIIAAYKDKMSPEDPAVEYVVENYDAFVAVAPENAVAAFVLESNYHAVQALSMAGDEAYLKQIDRLEGPLRRASEFQRRLEPDSPLLREYQQETFRGPFLAQCGRWREFKEHIEARLAKPDAERARILSSAAGQLADAEPEEYRELALDYAKRGYELDESEPFAVLTYSSALGQRGRKAEAAAVLEKVLARSTDMKGNWRNILADALARLEAPAEEPQAPAEE